MFLNQNLDETLNQTGDQSRNGRVKQNKITKLFDFEKVTIQLKKSPFMQYKTFKENIISYVTEQLNIIKENPGKYKPDFSAHISSLMIDEEDQVNWNYLEKYIFEACNVFFKAKEDAAQEGLLQIANNSQPTIHERLDKAIDRLNQAENNNLHLNPKNQENYDLFWKSLDSNEPINLTETTEAVRSVEHLLMKEIDRKKFYNFVKKPHIPNDEKVVCPCGVPRENIGPQTIQCDTCKVSQVVYILQNSLITFLFILFRFGNIFSALNNVAP